MAYKLQNIETPLKLLTTINAVDAKAGTGGGGGTSAPSFDYANQPYKSVEQLIADTRFRLNYRREFYDTPSGVLSLAHDAQNLTGFHTGGFEFFSTCYDEPQDGAYRIEPINTSAMTGMKITCVKTPTLPQVFSGTDEFGNPVPALDGNGDPIYGHFKDVASAAYDAMSLVDDVYGLPSWEPDVTDYPVLQLRFVGADMLFSGFGLIGKPDTSYTLRVKARQPAGKQVLAFCLYDYINAMLTGSLETCLKKIVPAANAVGEFVTTDASLIMAAAEGGNEPMPIGYLGLYCVISGLELGESVEIEFITVTAGATGTDPQADIDAETEIENVLENTLGVMEVDKGLLPNAEIAAYQQLGTISDVDWLGNFRRTFCGLAAPRPIDIPEGETSVTTSLGDLYIGQLTKIPPVSPLLSGPWLAMSGEFGRPLVYAVPRGMEYEIDPPMASITNLPAAYLTYGADDGYLPTYDLANNSGYSMTTGAISRIKLGDNVVVSQIDNGDTPYKELSLMMAKKIYLRPTIYTN